MISLERSVDRDWSEFENYASYLYARTAFAAQRALLQSKLNPTTAQREATATGNIVSQALPASDIQVISEEVASIRKSVAELRDSAEEVRRSKRAKACRILVFVAKHRQMTRCMGWMMDAIDRVKMSRTPKPIIRSTIRNEGQLFAGLVTTLCSSL
jgi:hypothetical protein